MLYGLHNFDNANLIYLTFDVPSSCIICEFYNQQNMSWEIKHVAVFMQTVLAPVLSRLMIDNSKLLTIFQVKFKLTNQSYSPSNISQSINIKKPFSDREVTNISTLHQ